MKKKVSTYTFHVPIEEILVIEVFAENEDEAWEKINNNDCHQVYSLAGTTKSGRTELKMVRSE